MVIKENQFSGTTGTINKMDFGIFRERHIGESCVLVCNGPSLNLMDLENLKKHTVIGLNKIYLGIENFCFYPKYLVCVNQKVIQQSYEEFNKMTSVKFIGDRGAHLVNSGPLCWPIKTSRFTPDFSYDIATGVQEGNTVTYAALQIAYFMGFTEVIIIGMDHSFSFTGKTNEEQTLVGKDKNHFSENYFSNLKWDTPDLERSEYYYKVANNVFINDGRKIWDATVSGKCDVFEKINYKEVL